MIEIFAISIGFGIFATAAFLIAAKAAIGEIDCHKNGQNYE